MGFKKNYLGMPSRFESSGEVTEPGQIHNRCRSYIPVLEMTGGDNS